VFTTYYHVDQIKEDEMGRACRTLWEMVNVYITPMG
jgi:hypothetical protein